MPQNGRSKEDLISKIYQVDTIYWILQCWSYYVRIKFSRHQHHTVIEPKTEWGGSRQQLFRRYCDSSGWRNNRQHRKSLLRNQIMIIKDKNALCLSVNVFSTKALIGDTIFYVSNGRRDRHFTWSSEPREGLACCSVKEISSCLSYWKTLSIGPAPGIEPATYRSAVLHALPTELTMSRFNTAHSVLSPNIEH